MAKLNILKVSAKNFRSIGNTPMEFDYTKPGIHLVSSTQNGSGKSTLALWALNFAFFGVPFDKKAKKNSMVNSRNNKNCEATVEFTTLGSSWKVVRGIKPNKFEIWKNGDLLDAMANVKDQQSVLEDILGFDVKVFNSVIALGKSRFVPFVEMSASERRMVVENLLDLTVFSTMKDLAAKQTKDLEESKRVLETKLSAENNMFDHFTVEKNGEEKLIESQRRAEEERINHMKADIESKSAEAEKLQKEKDKLTGLVDSLEDSEYEYHEAKQSIKDIDHHLNESQNRFNRLSKKWSELDEIIKLQTIIDSKTKEIEEAKDESKKITKSISSEYINEFKVVDDNYNKLKGEADRLSVMVVQMEKDLKTKKASNVCPTCGRPYDNVDIEKIIADAMGEINSLKQEEAAYKNAAINYKENEWAAEKQIVDCKHKLEIEKDRLQKSIESKTNEIENIQRQIDSCGNSDEFKMIKNDLEETTKLIKEYSSKKEGFEEIINKLTDDFNTIQKAKQDLASVKKEIEVTDKYTNQVKTSLDDFIKNLPDRKKQEEYIRDLENKIEDASIKIKQLQDEIEKLDHMIYIKNQAKALLDDKAVKSHIIKTYIPFVNQKVNSYLNSLNFYLSFNMDENFNVTIADPTRRNEDMFSLSAGQQSKVNLAILLAWRSVAAARSSCDTNIMILDEILEPLAADAVSEVLNLLRDEAPNVNYTVITQRGMEFAEYADQHTRYKLVNDFTEICTD